MKDYDFCGWATKNNLKCTDGRTIRHNAFKDCDGQIVPLVWNHDHKESANVLGNALLHNCDEGVYAYCTFNDTEAGKNAKLLVKHGDITSLSIWANQLTQQGGDVLHGYIKEVSLVLAGANPGAFIEHVNLAHSDGYEDDAIIYTGEEIYIAHSDEYEEEEYEDMDNYEDMEDYDEYDEEDMDEYDEYDDMDEYEDEYDEFEHSDEGMTVKEALDSMTEEQKTAMYAIIGQVVDDLKHNETEGDNEMKHNLFESDYDEGLELMHAEGLQAIIEDGQRFGSLKESYLAHADEYGIRDIDWLFPEARRIDGDGAPQFIKRTPDAWVDVVMNGVHKTPFSRIKMMFADLREDDARAKGYAQKGKLKKEEVFGLLKRSISPTTIYKKQKLDRDDVIDITDFDVISWLKSEMRMMLDEEIARAILFGDGRSKLSEDKIDETCIIPIVKEQPLFLLHQKITPAAGESFSHAFITAAVKGQDDYEGSGNTTLFTANNYITDMLLMEDKDGHRMYKDVRDLALAMSVNKIVKVPASIVPAGIAGVIIDLKDYNVGADKGGSVNMFDDFDIDYNQMKYLIETRCSGALTKPFSAIVLETESISG